MSIYTYVYSKPSQLIDEVKKNLNTKVLLHKKCCLWVTRVCIRRPASASRERCSPRRHTGVSSLLSMKCEVYGSVFSHMTELIFFLCGPSFFPFLSFLALLLMPSPVKITNSLIFMGFPKGQIRQVLFLSCGRIYTWKMYVSLQRSVRRRRRSWRILSSAQIHQLSLR